MALRIAIFGQAAFGKEFLERVLAAGHEVVAVFAPPESGRPDPLAERALELGLRVERRRYFQRRTGQAIPEALAQYRTLDAELNALAFVTAFLPREITDAPKHKSICFHPSLLPKYRGGAALAWQLILGETQSGVSVFVPDDGVDTGPILVQKGGVAIEPGDTAGSLYFNKLYALGLDAMLEAVERIEGGRAEPRAQDPSQASAQGLVDDEVARVDLARPAVELDRLVRGCDPQPGAHLQLRGQSVRLFDARLEPAADAAPGTIAALDESGLLLALDGGSLRVGRVRADRGKEDALGWARRAGAAVGDAFGRA